jgi:hypothetical protein
MATMKFWLSLVMWIAAFGNKLKRLRRNTRKDPRKMVMQHIQMPMNFQLVYVCARLEIADYLRQGPPSGSELANKVGAEPDTLYRLLRGLVMLEVLTEKLDGRFGLTPQENC